MQTTETPAQAVDQEPSKPTWRERANIELDKIVQLFSTARLPDLCAKALIAAPEKPSSKWSLGNQLLMILAGTSDARGYRQWNEVGRYVRKGSKAFHILGPVFVKKRIESTAVVNENEDEEVEVLVGFRTIPVFRYEETEGAELPTYTPRNPPPLLEVAERYGMKVNYLRLSAGVLGMTDYERQVITLATEDWTTFFHELAHSLHRSFEPKTGHGQEPEAETIAQLVAATLARLYGKPDDSFSWSYIAGQAQSSSPPHVGRMCMRVLDRAKKVLDLIYSNSDIGR
jgi:N-terminal domain of anti-restriction factor ArdC